MTRNDVTECKMLASCVKNTTSERMDWKEKLGIVLRSRGMPLADLAERSEIPYRTLQRWLAKGADPKLKARDTNALLRVLHLSYDQLFTPNVPLPAQGVYDIESPGDVAKLAEAVRKRRKSSA